MVGSDALERRSSPVVWLPRCPRFASLGGYRASAPARPRAWRAMTRRPLQSEPMKRLYAAKQLRPHTLSVVGSSPRISVGPCSSLIQRYRDNDRHGGQAAPGRPAPGFEIGCHGNATAGRRDRTHLALGSRRASSEVTKRSTAYDRSGTRRSGGLRSCRPRLSDFEILCENHSPDPIVPIRRDPPASNAAEPGNGVRDPVSRSCRATASPRDRRWRARRSPPTRLPPASGRCRPDGATPMARA